MLVFWLAVVVVTGGLAGKLQGAEKNDASAYRPASAESTQALTLDMRRWMWWPSRLAAPPAGQSMATPVSATALR